MSKMKRAGVALLIAAAAVAGPAVVSQARPQSGAGGTGGGGGKCWANPNPVAVGSVYQMQGSGMPAGRIVNIYVSDTQGTSWVSVMTSSSGSFSVDRYSGVAGSSSVRVTNSDRKQSTVASCSFSTV